jgi:hypothetical protein
MVKAFGTYNYDFALTGKLSLGLGAYNCVLHTSRLRFMQVLFAAEYAQFAAM